MPPVPSNSTSRLWIDYTTGYVEHTVMIRWDPALADISDAQAGLYNFLTDIITAVPSNYVFLRARAASQGSDISLPVTLASSLEGFEGTAPASSIDFNQAKECMWVGRSPTTGVRARMSLFGLGIALANDFRYTNDDWTAGATDAVVTLNGTPGVFVAVDGSQPTWYNYVNVQLNSYWERRIRLG